MPYHPISPISRRSAQDDLLGWGAVGDLIQKGRRGATPTGFGGGFDVVIVGAIHNVCEANLRLAKQSPLDRQFAKQIWTHGPYRFINDE